MKSIFLILMSRSKPAKSSIYTITLNDSKLQFDNAGSIFPYFDTLDTHEVTLNTSKRYFDRALIFANWYVGLSASDRKTALEISALTDDLVKTASKKALNKWMSNYAKHYNQVEDITAFCDLVATLGNDCLFNIICREFVSEFQSMPLSEFCDRYGFSNDFTPEELATLEIEKTAFKNLFESNTN